MKVLQVNTTDVRGGAARIAISLHEGYQDKGVNSRVAVGFQEGEINLTIHIPNNQFEKSWVRRWESISHLLMDEDRKSLSGITRYLSRIGDPERILANFHGHEIFNYPGTLAILEDEQYKADILQLHNLHGGYFDLRALKNVSTNTPTVLTLHDEWTFTGHCAYSIECERWRDACGSCPDLTIYPAIRRDGTSYNLIRKSEIYNNSSFYVTTPSQWLMDRAKDSILRHGMRGSRVINNGVDLSTFKPKSKVASRDILNLPQERITILFVGNRQKGIAFKDLDTMQAAVHHLSRLLPSSEISFIYLGDEGAVEQDKNLTFTYVPAVDDPNLVAAYYQAADIYLHAAKADTFPTTILESIACGTPVIATDVGGIPEQIEDGRDGYLVPKGDHKTMAEKMRVLLEDPDIKLRMGRYAAEKAIKRFDRNRMVSDYIDFFEEILSDEGRKTPN